MLRRMKSSQGDWRCFSYSSTIGLAIDLLLLPAVLLLDREHLAEAAHVALFAGELRRREGADELDGDLRPNDTRAEGEHVHVVVLDALVRGVRVVADGTADAGDLVRRDRCADAAPADQHAAVSAAGCHRIADRAREVGVVDGRLAVRAQVEHGMSLARELVDDDALEWESRVVGGDGEAHQRRTPLRRSASAIARSATCCDVNPSCSSTVFPGADAPKRPSMPMESPSSPTQRRQPSVTPASTESRDRISGGSTSSRYAWSCASNRSHDGMLTTRARTPWSARSACASTHSVTSEPVPMRMTSGRPSGASTST